MVSTALTPAIIKRAPKVLLHEHLDGGLRPETVVELARDGNYKELPTSDPTELAKWFIVDAPGSDLVRYLEGFAHTTAVMQTKDQIERVAFEAALDLARDGVVYAEIRFAPELHLEGGLTLHEVVEAVLEGFSLGMHDAELEGRPIVVRAILSAMRQSHLSETIAELAIEFRDRGVCGFDIAGPEDGFPPTHHL